MAAAATLAAVQQLMADQNANLLLTLTTAFAGQAQQQQSQAEMFFGQMQNIIGQQQQNLGQQQQAFAQQQQQTFSQRVPAEDMPAEERPLFSGSCWIRGSSTCRTSSPRARGLTGRTRLELR